jgi:cell division protein FtsI/penicillin-binding protein 2
MHRFSPFRGLVTMILIICGMIALMGRVAYLQTFGREQTIRKAERQQHQEEPLYSRRGGIFDANGMLMAGTVQTMSLFIDPKFMQDQFQEDGRSLIDMDKAIEKLANMIEQDPFELTKMLGDRYESRYVRVADGLDEQTMQAIEAMKLPGVGFTPMNVRNYPMGAIGAHVLGGVGADGKGLEGLELKFEKLLAGRDGYKRTLKDARRRPIAVNAEDYLPPQNGQHLVLTIDSNIQMIAEQELAASCTEFGAKRGEAIVMDPTTGEILAMANWPTFNPQNLNDSVADIRRNRSITDPYEPGSTIKPFIVGPSLMWKLINISEVMPIHGASYKSSLRPKLVTDVHGYDNLTVWDVLVKSSNIGMTMIGEKITKPNVHRALNLWNFGRTTGVELPGEDPGLLRPVARWSNSDVVSAVQGYSIMVTPLQLARSMCAYANGGRLVQPSIIRGVLDEDGNVVERSKPHELKDMPEVIDPMSAAQIRRVLADVPVRGTASGYLHNAANPGARSKIWNFFGKTGTSHVAAGGSYEDHYNASFLGGAPYENPRLVIAFVVHDPDPSKKHYGGTVAGPGAARVLERSLAYLQVPASPPLAPPPPHIASLLWSFNPKLYGQQHASAD